MKTRIVLCLLNVIWALLGVVGGFSQSSWLTPINAFVGGFPCCTVAFDWIEGKRPWMTRGKP